MARRVKAVSHEDRLTLVEHLDELRSRIVVCLVVLGVALALCFWQNHLLLEIASGPLPDDHKQLLTFGVTEPFTTTVTVATYGALILSLPILLYHLYAFVLPAFSDRERRVVLPILLAAPLLFGVGIAFAYFVVMPAAVQFLLGFNDGQFNVQVRARDYYSFFSMTMLAGGRGIGPALRLERRLDGDDLGAQALQQRLDRRVAHKPQPALQNLHRHVAVAEVPGEPCQRR